MSNVNTETLLIVFVALTGAAVLLQSFVLLALYFSVRKASKSVQDEMAELRAVVTPVATDAREFLTRVGPKIESVTADLAQMVQGLRVQSAEMQTQAVEILGRVQRQTSRLDAMLSGVLDTVDRAGAIVTDAVAAPLRQISGIVAFFRAATGTLRAGTPPPRTQPTHSAADKDLFV
ncbi:MAG TPA: hypothetical protein VE291_00790 [Terracidiphilus sp.]|jgi:hypothetical protein|nr:hypothetical protein [Terracidiphilus sp.]